MNVQIINKSGFPLPEYAKIGDAGVDLRASFKEGIKEDFLYFAEWDSLGNYLIIFSGGRALIPTNLYVAIPEGYELQIRPRSGLALKHGVTVLNTPGTIDAKK
jgi:dUTP pyrophosphatase